MLGLISVRLVSIRPSGTTQPALTHSTVNGEEQHHDCEDCLKLMRMAV